MAKAKKKRVFELARELGVDSKIVLEKCRAEGIEMDNHMAAVSIGLEATIREWFSEARPSGTAVETAEKVDLSKVRSKARRKAKSAASDADDASDTATATVEAPASEEESIEQKAVAAKGKAKPKPHKPAAEEQTSQSVTVSGEAESVVAEPQPTAHPTTITPPPQHTEVTGDAAAHAKPPTAEAPAPATPSPTSCEAAPPAAPPTAPVVRPAGPMLDQPQAAKLKGPKVVRIEAPEVIRQPRARSPRVTPEATDDAGVMRSRGPARGRGAGTPVRREDESSRSPRRKRGEGGPAGPATGRRTKTEEETARGKWRQQDLIERDQQLRGARGFMDRRRREMKRRAGVTGQSDAAAAVGGVVEVQEPISIKDLSAATGIKGSDIVKFLFNKGIMTTINAMIDTELAEEICVEYDIELKVKEAKTAEQQVVAAISRRDAVDVRRRPPIVAVLGHVDHGKTSLLDRIRKADVASGEHGGITQHIGAYRATIQGTDGTDKTVVFLDTPGHEAFTSMRSRGATLTDLVVLVVAADDGVMPQTVESIDHAKAAGVPIVVALNKIDAPQATEGNITKILGQLAERGLNPVEWGGETEVVRTSAITGQGVTDLIEVLDYQAELLDLKADYGGPAHGQVIEAELQPGRGPVARVLVRDGCMKIGDFVVVGRAFGRVRDMIDDRGNQLLEAGPATPLEISGIDMVPDAGDKFYVTETLKKAEEVAEQRREIERKQELAAKTKVTLDNFFEQTKAGAAKVLPVLVKADVQGSVEVLRKAIEDISTNDVSVRVVRAAVGGITESDVLLADASSAVIIGFHVIASQVARAEAERRGVDIRLYRIIYDITDDIRLALEGMLDPERREEVLGHAEVREVFRVSKVGAVAGCYVTDGVVRRNAMIRVTRDDIIIEYDRTLEQLKRFKDDAREVRSGMECGMKIEGYDDIRVGDVLECYVTREEKAKLPK